MANDVDVRLNDLEKTVFSLRKQVNKKWPQIYDASTDEKRDVTQEDVDQLVNIASTLGKIQELLRRQ